MFPYSKLADYLPPDSPSDVSHSCGKIQAMIAHGPVNAVGMKYNINQCYTFKNKKT